MLERRSHKRMPTVRRENKKNLEVIGLLPAAGYARRLAPLPCSKELYPIGFHKEGDGADLRPKVACHYLLEKMRSAGITKAYIVLRNGKWDIPAYLGDGTAFDMHIGYLMMRLPFGVPYTLDQAYPFIQDATVALGFPDIIFQTEDAFTRLLNRQAETNAAIVLGLFPVDYSQKWDMVDLADDGRIRRIVIKPLRTNLRYAWAIAVWAPAFTHFMHKYLVDMQKDMEQNNAETNASVHRELFVGAVIQAAIGDNLRVEGVPFPDNTCLDIGTSKDLYKAIRAYYIG